MTSARSTLRADDLPLYAITDNRFVGEKGLTGMVRMSLEGGATIIQLRDKTADEAALLAEAKELAPLCAEFGVPFIVNDNIAVALASGADGVHVGQSDTGAAEARALLGPDKILGVSAQTVEQALLAQAQGADYLGVGAVFPTSSKDDADAVSPETLAAICAAVDIPVVAIGGITRTNVGQLAGAGLAGISVISAVYGAPDIAAATADLKTAAASMVAANTPADLPRPAIKAAIFDMDGTIIDSLPTWHSFASRFLSKRGLQPEPNIDETVWNMSLEQSAEYLLAHYPLDMTKADVLTAFQDDMTAYYVTEPAAKSGAREVLELCRARGIHTAVLTATFADLAESGLRLAGLRDLISDGVISTTDLTADKHDRASFDHVAALLGAAPEETLVFEDSSYALATASAAGYHTVGLYDAFAFSDPARVRSSAETYLTDLADFPHVWRFSPAE